MAPDVANNTMGNMTGFFKSDSRRVLLRLFGVIGLGAFAACGSDDNLTVVSWPGNTPAGMTNVTAIGAGDFHNLVQRNDGTVVSWGDAVPGKNSVPAGLSDVAAISAAYFNLGLLSNSTVVCWGDNSSSQTNVPGGLTNIMAVSAGDFHGLALLADGTVANWGGNFHNQLDQPPGLANVAAIAAGSYHSLALRINGTVVAWGWNDYGQLNISPGLSGVAAVAAGWGHNLALRTNGTLVGWGYNAYGQLNIPAGLSNVIAISTGFQHSLALKSDGTVVAWGYNSDGQTDVPAGLSHVVAISGGAFHNLALTRSPGVAIQPQSQSVFPGDPALFNVQATGSTPLSYQWQFNGVDVPSATNASFTATNVQPGAPGNYRVVVLNAYGSVTSSNASLNFNQPPGITVQPESQTVRELENVSFAVSAAGTAPLSYQWRLNGTELAGATNSSLTLNSVHTTNAGDYSVQVTNIAGQIISSNALLRVSPTFIIDNPAAMTVGTWTTGSVRSATYGSNYLFKNQGTGANYVEFTPSIAEPGIYQVHEFHPATSAHTTNASHVITFDGGAQTIAVNQKTNGTKWNLLGAFNLAAGTAANVRITDTIPEPAQIVGADAIMFVKVLPPLIISQPADRLVNEGAAAQFEVRATATPPWSYQWRKGGIALPTGTSAVLILTNVQPADAGTYDVVVSNSAGFATSSNATMTVRPLAKAEWTPSSLVLAWPAGFVLQSSTNVAGPFSDVPNASSPHTNVFAGAARFFRLRN